MSISRIFHWAATALFFATAHAAPTPDPLHQLAFIANQGQAPEEILAYTPTQAGVTALTRDGRLIHAITQPTGLIRLEERFTAQPLRPRLGTPAPTRVSYFLGNDHKKWRRGLPSHQTVTVGEIAPGIRLELISRPRNVEKRFHLAPGADLSALHIRITGGRGLSIDANGELVIDTPTGPVRFTAPIAWQPRADGGRDPIPVAYTVDGDRYGFQLQNYDPRREVIIDPLLGTALLRDANAEVRDMAIGPFGNVFIVGHTISSTLAILASGTYDTGNEAATTGEAPAYIAKFSRDLSQLLALTFLNGVNTDPDPYTTLTGLVVTAQGEVIVAGYTNASDFPMVNSTIALTNSAAGTDFIIARLDNDLAQLLSSAYLAGSGDDGNSVYHDDFSKTVDLALAPDGQSVYLAGTSLSSDLPTNQGSGGDPNEPAYQPIDPHPNTPTYVGLDCYLAQLPLDLTAVNATWVGNSLPDADWSLRCNRVGTDAIGSVFVAGTGFGQIEAAAVAQGAQAQQSTDPSSPYSDNGDALIARLSADLRTLHNAAFLGGFDGGFEENTPEAVWDMKIAENGEVILGGQTASPSFPTTAGTLNPQVAGLGDGNLTVGFVARLDNSLVPQATTLIHGCPQNTQGQADCASVNPISGTGKIIAVEPYSYTDSNNVNHIDIYALYRQDEGAFGIGAPMGFTNGYFSLPIGLRAELGLLSLHRLDDDLGLRLAATDLNPTPSNGSSYAQLALSHGFFDGGRVNQNDPRLYLTVSWRNPAVILHPQGYAGPTHDEFGTPLTDKGVYIAAFDFDLARGTSPNLSFVDQTTDFGHIPLNSFSAARLLTLSNQGSDTLTVYTGFFETNDGTWHYASSGDCPAPASNTTFPFTLAPGTQCTLGVYLEHDRTTGYTFSARLHLVSNDPNGAVITSPTLTARATPLYLDYTGANGMAVDYQGRGLDFGELTPGQTASRTVTVIAEADNVTIDSSTFSGGDSGQFTLDSDGCSGRTLDTNDRCQIQLSYTPAADGEHSTQLQLSQGNALLVSLRLHGKATSNATGGSGGSGGGGTPGNTTGGTGSGSNPPPSSGSGSGGLFGLASGVLELTLLLALAGAWWQRRTS